MHAAYDNPLRELISGDVYALLAEHNLLNAKGIRDYLLNNMQACGISKIESPWFVLSVKQNPPAVVIDDEASIPAD